MGNASWDANTSAVYRSTAALYSKAGSYQEVFTNRNMNPDYNPCNFDIRESCDSDSNPESNAIIIGLDVTGSMGSIAHEMAKQGLGALIESILDQKPVSDPHLMFMGIGDAATDNCPIQMSQFEADIRIVEQLTELFMEGRGGGNATESYDFAWYMAANNTKIDCFDKRGKKGYLFTIGDEMWPNGLTAKQIERFTGVNPQRDFTADQLMAAAQEQYHVFHLIVEEGSFCRFHSARGKVVDDWRGHMGKRALPLSDYRYMPQVIVTAMNINEGADPIAACEVWEDQQIVDTVKHAFDLD